MSRSIRQRGILLRDNRRGVSEVVGSVLLLLMTVAVFSGIIIFVNSIQGPGDQTYVDLIPALERTGPDSGYIAITHAGGNPLHMDSTLIIIQVNSSRFVLQVADGLTPVNNYWVTGQKWQLHIGSPTLVTGATVQVSVVDTSTNQLVLLAVVQRGVGTGGTFPLIGAGTVIPDGVVTNDGKKLFQVRVIAVDYDNDLPSDGVRVDLSPLGCSFGPHTLVHKGFGVYESPTALNATSCVAAKTYIVNITATDLASQTTTATMPVTVVKPVNTTTPPPSTGTGPFGWLFSSEFQAYEIYNATEWDTKRFNGTATRTFIKGETVVVLVASQYIKNLDLQNDLMLYGTNDIPVVPIVYGGGGVTTATIPSSFKGFTFNEFIGGFFVYEARFSTDSSAYGYNGTDLEYGRYTLEMVLRSTNIDPPRNRFATADEIRVTDEDGNLPDYPRLELFEDSAYTTPANLFHFTDTVYVRVTVKSTDVTALWGDVTISDYIGGIQIWARPGTMPVSSASIASITQYTFNIDLTDPNNDPWVFGQNSYGFKIRQLIDVDEEYALATQIVIRGPDWALDVINAIDEYGHPVFAEKWYALFYHNDQLWSPTVVERYESLPSQQTPPFGGGKFFDVAFGDVDEDGDLDALMGIEKGRVFLYRNDGGQGFAWDRYEVDNLVVPVLSVAMGRLDADTDRELVAGTSGGEIWVYDNDGRFTPRLVADLNSEVLDIKVADVTGDSRNDLIIATKSGNIRIYINDGFGGFGTVVTADYVVGADSAVEGTVGGTFLNTISSNNGYETIREVLGTGQIVQSYEPLADLRPAFGTIESGSYANTLSNDGSPYEILAEGFYDGPGTGDKWLLRNSSAGASPGHQYPFGDISSLGAGDSANLVIDAFLVDGTEPIEIRYKVGNGSVSSVLATITATSETTRTIPLTGFTGGELYIVLQDSDITNNDASSDAKQTKVAIDYLSVQVTRASGTTSRLEHKWQTATIGGGGDAYRLFVEAHHTANAEADHFIFQWSSSSTGPWADLIMVEKTADDDIAQTAILPSSVGGTQIWLRVVDSNRTANATTLDTVSIDHIFVRRFVTVPNFETISAGSEVREVTAADMDGDGDNDIVAAVGNNVNIYYAPSWSARTLAAGAVVLSVDVGHFNDDRHLDVIAGTDTQKVYLWTNAATFSRTELVDLSVGSYGKPISIEAGDVDSDLWDDYVVGTENGYILWFRHVKGTSWSVSTIENLEKPVYGLDLGDADRGIIRDYAL